jgi:hypothetical protein
MNVMKMTGFAMAAAVGLLACSGGEKKPDTQIVHNGAPDWVNRGGGAFSGEKGRMFYGVGVADHKMAIYMRRNTADDRARADIVKTLNSYVTVLKKDYAASTIAGDAAANEEHVEQALKNYSQMDVSGIGIVDHWQDGEGNLYALGQMDLEAFKNNLDKVKELNQRAKDAVRANADKAFDELNAEEAKHAK